MPQRYPCAVNPLRIRGVRLAVNPCIFHASIRITYASQTYAPFGLDGTGFQRI